MKTNPPTFLPHSIAQYLEHANRFDAAGAIAFFTSDAIVRDEHKEHVGHAAIARWIAESSASAQPQVTPTQVHTHGETVKMTGRVVGTFPGSPIDLDYEFRLRDGNIAFLAIQ